jgi:SAM-dependent methyltransferase
LGRTIASYDANAAAYADYYFPKHAMHDHLDRFLALLPAQGPVIDMGCGPGQDSAYLAGKGREVIGADLCPGMIREATRRVPTARFMVHDMRNAWTFSPAAAGIWLCSSLLHLPRNDVLPTLQHLKSAMRSDGVLYLSVMRGRGREMKLEQRPFGTLERLFTYFEDNELVYWLTSAGFSHPIVQSKGRWLWLFIRRDSHASMS